VPLNTNISSTVEDTVERSPNASQRRGGMIRGIAAEERFVYEIMQLCLVITLTNLDDLLKIRRIQKQKEKRLTRSLPY
jgi:hypothetical protein